MAPKVILKKVPLGELPTVVSQPLTAARQLPNAGSEVQSNVCPGTGRARHPGVSVEADGRPHSPSLPHLPQVCAIRRPRRATASWNSRFPLSSWPPTHGRSMSCCGTWMVFRPTVAPRTVSCSCFLATTQVSGPCCVCLCVSTRAPSRRWSWLFFDCQRPDEILLPTSACPASACAWIWSLYVIYVCVRAHTHKEV